MGLANGLFSAALFFALCLFGIALLALVAGAAVAIWMIVFGKLPIQRENLCPKCAAEQSEPDTADLELRQLAKSLELRRAQ